MAQSQGWQLVQHWAENQRGLWTIVRWHKLSSMWPLLTAWCSSRVMDSFQKGVFPGRKAEDCVRPSLRSHTLLPHSIDKISYKGRPDTRGGK